MIVVNIFKIKLDKQGGVEFTGDSLLLRDTGLYELCKVGELEKLKKDNGVLMEALRFYSQGGDWDYYQRNKDGVITSTSIILNDHGKRAREAIAKVEGEV